MKSETLTATKVGDASPLYDYPFCVLTAAQPLGPSSRHALAGVEVVEVGRGKERRARREGKHMRLDVPDARLSSTHARLVRTLAGWAVEDLKAKNAVYHNDRQIERAELADGDVLELGYTFFVFRSRQPASPWLDLDATELDAAQPQLG